MHWAQTIAICYVVRYAHFVWYQVSCGRSVGAPCPATFGEEHELKKARPCLPKGAKQTLVHPLSCILFLDALVQRSLSIPIAGGSYPWRFLCGVCWLPLDQN